MNKRKEQYRKISEIGANLVKTSENSNLDYKVKRKNSKTTLKIIDKETLFTGSEMPNIMKVLGLDKYLGNSLIHATYQSSYGLPHNLIASYEKEIEKDLGELEEMLCLN